MTERDLSEEQDQEEDYGNRMKSTIKPESRT
jgi:hypothetical protein